MKNAVDYSYARPSGAELKQAQLDALFYTGNARPDQPYVDDLRANDVGVVFIQETYSARSQEGYQAGVYDAQFADQRASERGYPTSCAIVYVVSDGSAYDPNYGGGNIADYGQGVADTSQRPFVFYGNRYAVDNARAGAARSGGGSRCLGGWVPSSWNPVPSPGGPDLLVQEANLASPIADTDLNTVYAPYGSWGGSVVPTPTPKKKERPDMFIGAKKRGDTNAFDAALVDGGFVIRWLDGNDQQPWGPFGLTLPQSAFDLASQLDTKVLPLDVNEWSAIEKRTWNSWQPLPAGSGTPAPLDYDALGKAIASHVKVTVTAS